MNDKSNFNEKELDDFMNSFKKRKIEVPDELQESILNRVKIYKNNTSYVKKILVSMIITILLFVGGVRFSPKFAAYASKIEMLKPIIDFIRHGDKGIETAYENGYNKMNEITFEKNGFILYIDNIFVDEDRL